MRRIILTVLVNVFIAGFTFSLVLAKEKNLPLTASASSTYKPSYTPNKAVDGDINTYWAGAIGSAPWWIMFDTGAINQVDEINIKWYSQPQYIPQDYDIQISDDGITWENLFTGIAGIYDVNGEVREISRQTRYIRLYINTVTGPCPVLAELTAYIKITIPRLFRFQARLGDAQEIPLNGIFTLTFRLYDVETEGIPIWEEVQQNINVEDGVLDIELGNVTPLGLLFYQQYWLGIKVENDNEMTPRFKLTTVPYSFISEE